MQKNNCNGFFVSESFKPRSDIELTKESFYKNLGPIFISRCFFYVWQKRDFLDIFCKTIYEDNIT